jgi:hypothetical protein
MIEDDDLIPEIESPPTAVPETSLVFRLEPVKASGRYIAVIAAENEKQARRFAADADPFGAEWENPSKYRCTRSEVSERHVVGDVAFQSVPAPQAPMASKKAKAS